MGVTTTTNLDVSDAMNRAARDMREAHGFVISQLETGGSKISNKHFIDEHLTERGILEARKEEQKKMQIQLIVIDSAEWTQLYFETMDLIHRAEILTAQALEAQTGLFNSQSATLQDMKDAANQTLDGTMVFKNEHGDVVDQHGRAVDPVAADSVVWRDGAPTYEEFLAQKELVKQTQQRIAELERYQTDVLGAAREEMQSETKPSAERMEEIQERVHEQAPEAIADQLAPPSEQTARSEPTAFAIMKPPM